MRLLALLLVVFSGFAVGDVSTTLPPVFTPPDRTGVIRIWGHPALEQVVAKWMEGFRVLDPDIRFEVKLSGSDIAMAGLYTGQADIVLMGREATPSEVQAFEWVYQYKPTRMEVLTGSLATPGQSPALQILVHEHNPLRALTLEQIDAVFSHERRRGGDAVETWGDLGLTGEWKDQSLYLYSPDTESGTGRYFREAALGGSRHLEWARLTEFAPQPGDGTTSAVANRALLEALASDTSGIAVGIADGSTAGVRALAVAAQANGQAIMASADSVASRHYPLVRSVNAYLNHAPGTPLDSSIKRLFRYLYTEAGQAAAASASDYFALHPALLAAQRAALEALSNPEAAAWAEHGRPLPQPRTLQPRIDEGLPNYEVRPDLAGHEPVTIRATAILGDLVGRWLAAFRDIYPEARIALQRPFAHFDETVADLASGRAGAVFVSGEAVDSVVAKFINARGHAPVSFAVCGGSYDHHGFMDAGAVVVHRDNPLGEISIAQLRKLFSTSVDAAVASPVTRWGELGLGGDWADASVHALRPGHGALERFMHERINGPGFSWCEHIPALPVNEIMARIESDPLAIGLGKLAFLPPSNKALAVGEEVGGPYHAADYETAMQGRYPLARFLYVYLDPEQSSSSSDVVAELVKFIVSREGQQIVLDQGVFLPLRADQVTQP